jgi:TorA maturation chaperone TorD
LDVGNHAPGVAAADRDTEAGRARVYALLATLLVRPPDAALLARLEGLAADGTTLGEALAALGEAASAAEAEGVEREFHDLFIGIARGELLPYASYYLTGFLHERPLARLRGDLAALGIERAQGVAEPEDHIATLCEVMAGLIEGGLGAGAEQDRRFFERHLRPWVERFFADLEQAQAARFYRAVGRLGRVFIGIETEAFALPA